MSFFVEWMNTGSITDANLNNLVGYTLGREIPERQLILNGLILYYLRFKGIRHPRFTSFLFDQELFQIDNNYLYKISIIKKCFSIRIQRY
jgi:hypothetical protein